MPQPLLTDVPFDFGPSAFIPSADSPAVFRLHGERSSQLRSQLRRLCPRKPGVYGMISANGELIYVGKAKSLRARLLSYFRPRSRGPRAGKILRQSKSLVWEVAASEFAALLRELELIRRWRPPWNIQGQPLRRQWAFVCIGGAPAPHAYLSRSPGGSPGGLRRSARSSTGRSACRFGPIPAGRRAYDAVRRLNDVFQLRDCPQPQEMIFAEEVALFPGPLSAGCLRLEIGTCLGPCAGACSRKTYHDRARAATAFLAGRHHDVVRKLESAMAAAATAQAYERAATLRDQIESLGWLMKKLADWRTVRERLSFVYPVRGHDRRVLWYLIHGGRTLGVALEPTTSEECRTAEEMLQAVFFQQTAPLDSFEYLDGMLLAASWFRRHPLELRKTISPAQALDAIRARRDHEGAKRRLR